jgi:hypothetical protein
LGADETVAPIAGHPLVAPLDLHARTSQQVGDTFGRVIFLDPLHRNLFPPPDAVEVPEDNHVGRLVSRLSVAGGVLRHLFDATTAGRSACGTDASGKDTFGTCGDLLRRAGHTARRTS